MNSAERKLFERFSWLSDADLQALSKRPWLEVFIQDGDESLVAARARHSAAQKEARIQLRKQGKEPHRRMVVRGNIQTTAYEDPIHREMK